jgi:hypothetical protein
MFLFFGFCFQFCVDFALLLKFQAPICFVVFSLYVCNKHDALDLFYSFIGSLFCFVCSSGMKL